MAYSATPDGGPDGTYSKVFGPQILVISGMQLLMVLDGTVAALALPRISKSMHWTPPPGTGSSRLTCWPSAALMLAGGRLGDTYGRKRRCSSPASWRSPSPRCCAASR